MEEKILDKMRKDHFEILGLMRKVLISTCDNQCKEFFDEAKTLLIKHMVAEEESVYKRLIRDVDEQRGRILALSSENEHHQAKEYIQRLNLMNINDPAWMKMFHDLFEIVATHFKIEEEVLFKEIKEDFSREELVEIDSEFEGSRATPS
jgi:hemerythrin superfamily protein